MTDSERNEVAHSYLAGYKKHLSLRDADLGYILLHDASRLSLGDDPTGALTLAFDFLGLGELTGSQLIENSLQDILALHSNDIIERLSTFPVMNIYS